MGTDAESHSQALDRAQEILLKRGRRVVGARGARVITREPTKATGLLMGTYRIWTGG